MIIGKEFFIFIVSNFNEKAESPYVDSNVEAGRLFGIPLRGTHSHAFVSSYMVREITCDPYTSAFQNIMVNRYLSQPHYFPWN